jgi:hypothetical protein
MPSLSSLDIFFGIRVLDTTYSKLRDSQKLIFPKLFGNSPPHLAESGLADGLDSAPYLLDNAPCSDSSLLIV